MPSLLEEIAQAGEAIIQKGKEMVCEQVARDCSSQLLKHLSDTLQGSAQSANNAAVDFCIEATKACSGVWLKQYAIPLTIAAVIGTTAVACCYRPRR